LIISLGSEKDDPEVAEEQADSDEYVTAIFLFLFKGIEKSS